MAALPESLGAKLPKGVCGRTSGRWSLRVVNPVEIPTWNRMLEQHRECSVFQTAEWMSVLAETYAFHPACLLFQRDDRAPSIVSLMEVDDFIGRRKGSGLPFSDFCEPLVSEPKDSAEIWESALAQAEKRSWRFLELRGGGALIPGAPESISFLGHELDLNCSLEQVFQRFDGSVRRAIRKAEREGVLAEVSKNAAAVEEYYLLHCLTRKRHGLPPQPVRLFRSICKHLVSKGLGFVVTARYHGRAIAAALFLQFAGKALFKFGASDQKYQRLRGNDLVMWQGIQALVGAGCRVLHFGRTSMTNLGLIRFKRQWGGQERKIGYHRYDLRNKRFVQESDSAVGWYNPLFRLAPIWLGRAAGILFYRRAA